MDDPLRHVYSFIATHCWLAQREPGYHKARRVIPGFVTISRQTGAGEVTIAEKLADHLSKELPGDCPWTVFDKNLVYAVIQEHHLAERILPFLQEANIPEIQDTLDDLFGLHPPQFTLVQRTTQTILHLARMGRVILVGRGAPLITKGIPGGVHVRLVGSFKKRKDHIKEEFQLTDKEADFFIKKEDQGRSLYLKKYFNQDIETPLLYDLIINTDRVSYDEAVRLIADLVIQKIRSDCVVLRI